MRSALSQIYRHQRVHVLALVVVGTRVRSSTLPHPFPDLNPTSRQRLSDRFTGHLRSVRNNDVDKPVGRHFNAANHSISDIKVCAISPISGGNDGRIRCTKRLIFKIETIHPYRINGRFSFISSYPFMVSVFV